MSLDERDRKITLKHEETKGLMAAMTMEFPVKSAELLKDLRQGDRVRFKISPQGSDFVVENVVKGGKEALR